MDKRIILIPNQQPQFVGNWTFGEIRQMAQALLQWLDTIPLTIQQPAPVKSEQEK